MVSAMKIVVNGYGVFVGVKNRMASIRSEEGEKEISLGNLRQIVVASGGVAMSSSFLRLASENGIDVIVLNSNGSISGIFLSSLLSSKMELLLTSWSIVVSFNSIYKI